jgi:hypothetical protein
MLQCGLVRSNFALAIHIHPCRRRSFYARHLKRGWFTLEKRPCSSQNFWANLALTMPGVHLI